MCLAPASKQTSISFAEGLEMTRCSACDTQTWTLNGQPVEADRVQSIITGRYPISPEKRDLLATRAAEAKAKAQQRAVAKRLAQTGQSASASV